MVTAVEAETEKTPGKSKRLDLIDFPPGMWVLMRGRGRGGDGEADGDESKIDHLSETARGK